VEKLERRRKKKRGKNKKEKYEVSDIRMTRRRNRPHIGPIYGQDKDYRRRVSSCTAFGSALEEANEATSKPQ
jgi:hypothetical protein